MWTGCRRRAFLPSAWFLSFSVFLLGTLLGACSRAPVLTYEQEIAAWRAEKDAYMRSSDSPVPPEERDGFPPLEYFPVSEDFRVPAQLEVTPGEEIIEMSTSTGLRRKMRKIGTLRFTLDGQPVTLTAFTDASDQRILRLFVPFRDLTSGTETYAGGRYLDLDRTATGIYDLDFNRAYNPFCVFNVEYDCPLPPRENRLPVPIRAGEKLFSS